MKFKCMKYYQDCENDKEKEHYEETDFSRAVESFINSAIGDIAKDLEREKEILLNKVKSNDGLINNIYEIIINVRVKNQYMMNKDYFNDAASIIRKALITRKAVESLEKERKIELKDNIGFELLRPSMADIQINIDHDSGNHIVYVYDLYFNNVYDILN